MSVRGILAAVMLWTVPCISGREALSRNSAEFEASVGRWIHLRQELTRLRSRWTEEQQVLEHERDLLDQQKASLSDLLEHRHDASAKLSEHHAELARQTAVFHQAMEDLHAPLTAAEKRLLDLRQRLPDFLFKRLSADFAELERVQERGTDPLVSRIQRVFGILAELESAAASLHHVPLVLTEPGGTEREMDALFLGIAAGYAVSPDGSRAAIGRAGQGGWNWQWAPEYAGPIRAAIEVYNQGSAARLIVLPLKLEGLQ